MINRKDKLQMSGGKPWLKQFFLGATKRKGFQLFVIILIAVLMPMGLRVLGGGVNWSNQQMQNTVYICIASVVLGYVLFHQLVGFPGAHATKYIWFSLIVTFGLALIVILLFRIEYSRYQVFVSFIAAVLCFYYNYFINRRMRRLRFFLVPGGSINELIKVPDVEWVLLTEPKFPQSHITGVVADLRTEFSDEWMRYVTESAVIGNPVFHFKQIKESLSGRVELEHLSENSLGSLIPGHVYIETKQAIDWVVALVVLLFLWPLLALTALCIRIESSGAAIYRQERIGLRGRVFTMYKFRTMMVSKDTSSDRRDQYITKDEDNRITGLGRILRKYRIDEFPQIINILRGEMSWIGPRPEAVPLSKWYEGELPFYRYRHIVRPGISGWAQVSQGHVVDVDEVLDKLHYDFYYIKYISFWLDVLIVFRTVKTMLNGFGAR